MSIKLLAKAMKHPNFCLGRSKIISDNGFTLIELIVVVAVLTILGGMAVPSVMAYVRTAHVNEGKALLNAAVSDCLRTAASTPQNLATTTPVTLQEALAGTRATPLGYMIEKDPHCSTGLSLKATTSGMIDLYAEVKSDGTVIKKAATQENDTSSSSQLNCEQWGGKANCQDAAEIARQKAAAIAAALAAAEAERARLAAIEKQKADEAAAALAAKVAAEAAAAETARQAAIDRALAEAQARAEQSDKRNQGSLNGLNKPPNDEQKSNQNPTPEPSKPIFDNTPKKTCRFVTKKTLFKTINELVCS